MSPTRARKSRIYEKWYGQPYIMKTLEQIKVCQRCGKEQPINSSARHCPSCGATLRTKYVQKQKTPP